MPVRNIDLHLHSTFSDGLKTPDELCVLAQKAGVSRLALCDHDTVSSLPAMRKACKEHGLVLIPGVEISTGQGGKMHVLCYGANVESPEMKAFLDGVARERTGRAQSMIKRLEQEGVLIPEERRAALLSHPTVGRAHIARELIALGAVNTMQQAFDRYLSSGRPAYVPRTQLSTDDTVSMLRGMNVLPVLAHPIRSGVELNMLHALVRSLRERGLAGVEAWHPSANARTARQIDLIARQENLLVTGGSDYHGDPGSTVHIGRLPAGWTAREEDFAALQNALSHF